MAAQVSPENRADATRMMATSRQIPAVPDHPGGPATKHFAELVDQRRGRRVNELAAMTKPDDAAIALGNADEVEGLRPFNVAERDAMHRGDLVRTG